MKKKQNNERRCSGLRTHTENAAAEQQTTTHANTPRSPQSVVGTSKITIPAVKITGDALLLADEPMMLPVSLCPDPCLSTSVEGEGTGVGHGHEQLGLLQDTNNSHHDTNCGNLGGEDDDVVLIKQKEPTIPSLLTDVEEETDLGAFLLDAVNWL